MNKKNHFLQIHRRVNHIEYKTVYSIYNARSQVAEFDRRKRILHI